MYICICQIFYLYDNARRVDFTNTSNISKIENYIES